MPRPPFRTLKTRTPGAPFEPEPEAAAPEQPAAAEGTDAAPAAFPPDLQAVVDATVERALAAERARNDPAPRTAQEKLPTQAEAIAMLEANPVRRSVLSVDGYVVRQDGWTVGAGY